MNGNQEERAVSMDVILTHRERELAGYFGAPVWRGGNLCVFEHGEGRLFVVFEQGKAAAYALYDKAGSLVHATLRTVSLTEEQRDGWSEKNATDFAAEYGHPHADVGSGAARPVYLSDRGSLYALTVSGGRIRRIAEFKPGP